VKKLRLYHHPGFAAPIGPHIMPMRKFALVAAELRNDPRIEIVPPPPVSRQELLRVHSADYISAVETGQPRDLAESQKFPWSPELYPSVLLTSGGVLAASETALHDGVSGVLASGFHHSGPAHGEGFCTFNGLVVALEHLRATGKIRTAAVLDLDLHYGNGTASLAATRPWLRALSLYGNDYWDNVPYRDVRQRHHSDGPNHQSIPLIPGANDGAHLLSLLDKHLPWLLEPEKPDLLLYQAGADPLRDDPYSPLDLGHEDLFRRDRAVFDFALDHRIPVAWTLAGGYTPEIEKIVRVHTNTALACLEALASR